MRNGNHEPLFFVFFFRGGGVQDLVGDESEHQTRHVSNDQPVAMHQKIALQWSGFNQQMAVTKHM